VTLRLGIIGGGQLARMMIPPAIEMGLDVRVLAESDDSSARIAASHVGDYRNVETVLAFAKGLDVVTFDHEHVPHDVLSALVAAGVAVRPGPAALLAAQDKGVMRQLLSELGAPVPRWALAESASGVESFLHGGASTEIVAKTPRGGYDGKGVAFISDASEVSEWLAAGPILLEDKVPFTREVAQLVARRPSGDMATWPLVETRQRGGVCAEVIAPAAVSSETAAEARTLALSIAESLDVTGVLAVEMFVLESGELVVNELAMRPHNSGHVFTELSTTSQFEQHLRAVLDLPLGETTLLAPKGIMVNVFGGVIRESIGEALAVDGSVKVHDYGKDPRPGRKAGHVTVIGDDPDLLATAQRAASIISVDGLA
jgi:5-(carboxyamino)imidazole ribonucleotide synthase